MRGTIQIQFDTDNGKVMVGAPMDNQEQKDLTVKVLSAAMGIVIDFKPSIIKPITNGHAPVVPPMVKPN